MKSICRKVLLHGEKVLLHGEKKWNLHRKSGSQEDQENLGA